MGFGDKKIVAGLGGLSVLGFLGFYDLGFSGTGIGLGLEKREYAMSIHSWEGLGEDDIES